MWWKIALIVIVGLATVFAVASLYGANRWQPDTGKLHAKLEAAQLPIAPKSYDPHELNGLPAPAQRYFRAVLREGQPLVTAVTVEQVGTFNMSQRAEQWRPFAASHRVVAKQPGFVWDARIAMLPGVSARVHDAYLSGEGILPATLFGLVSLVEMRGTPEVAQGELMRFFAEAA